MLPPPSSSHMKPDARGPIYWTMVSTTPSSWFGRLFCALSLFGITHRRMLNQFRAA
jgi:hypothetical protein